ncbi:MAG: DUF4097 domain-containing protein [Streptococcaceae bacterium]|jgi:hypothetical protein|nr:DUF4097 domain-containing protein [Streptococcaceae bacterium]
MKMKPILLAGASLVAIGGVLLGSGLALGGNNNIEWREGRPVISTVINHTEDIPSNIKNLVIDTTASNVRVIQGSQFQLSSHLRDSRAQLEISGDTATISGKTNPVYMNIGVNFHAMNEEIVITVPRNVELSSVIINGVNNSVALSQIFVKDIEIAGNESWVSMNSMEINSLKVERGSGGFSLTDVQIKEDLNLSVPNISLNLHSVKVPSINLDVRNTSVNISDLTIQKASKITLENAFMNIHDLTALGVVVKGEGSTLEKFTNEGWLVEQTLPYEEGNSKEGLTIEAQNSSVQLQGLTIK